MALFSMTILHDERVVVVAEQKPNCTDEEVSAVHPISDGCVVGVAGIQWMWLEHYGCVVGVAGM